MRIHAVVYTMNYGKDFSACGYQICVSGKKKWPDICWHIFAVVNHGVYTGYKLALFDRAGLRRYPRRNPHQKSESIASDFWHGSATDFSDGAIHCVNIALVIYLFKCWLIIKMVPSPWLPILAVTASNNVSLYDTLIQEQDFSVPPSVTANSKVVVWKTTGKHIKGVVPQINIKLFCNT